MKDCRVKVKVVFTIDVGVEDKIFASSDKAEEITREVFEKSFSRAHLLKIDAIEILSIYKEKKNDF